MERDPEEEKDLEPHSKTTMRFLTAPGGQTMSIVRAPEDTVQESKRFGQIESGDQELMGRKVDLHQTTVAKNVAFQEKVEALHARDSAWNNDLDTELDARRVEREVRFAAHCSTGCAVRRPPPLTAGTRAAVSSLSFRRSMRLWWARLSGWTGGLWT